MKLPAIHDSSCKNPGTIILPRVIGSSCSRLAAPVLPNIAVDGCILAGTAGPAPAQIIFPGPDWGSFDYGVPICLGCQGVGVSGIPSDIGGFSATSPYTVTTPPTANFDLQAAISGGAFFEYTINDGGFVTGVYTGPACNCQLTLTNTITGGLLGGHNGIFVAVFQNGGSPQFPGAGAVLNIGSLAGATGPIVAGTTIYSFSLPLSVNNVINVHLGNQAGPSSLLRMIGSFANVG